MSMNEHAKPAKAQAASPQTRAAEGAPSHMSASGVKALVSNSAIAFFVSTLATTMVQFASQCQIPTGHILACISMSRS